MTNVVAGLDRSDPGRPVAREVSVDDQGRQRVVTDLNLSGVTLSDAAAGAQNDVPASWFSAAASRVALLKLLAATVAGAGSHVFSYNASGQLVTDAWTLFGSTYTKTYGYNGAGQLITETDWI